jgi:hypothetical protein
VFGKFIKYSNAQDALVAVPEMYGVKLRGFMIPCHRNTINVANVANMGQDAYLGGNVHHELTMATLIIRTQILLTKEQMNYLAKLKKKTGESIGSLIRRWIDEERTKEQKKG